jgi:hypothetical protein
MFPYPKTKVLKKEIKKISQLNKSLMNKFNQGGENSVHYKLLNIDERSYKRHKEMKIYPMPMY